MNIRHPAGLPAFLNGVEHALVVGVLNVFGPVLSSMHEYKTTCLTD